MAEDKKLIFKTALIYFQEGRWDKTITEFKRLVAIDPEDMNAKNMLGDAHLKKGSAKEAYEEYSQAAEGYSKKGEGEKANVIFRKMAKLEVKNLDAAQQKKHRIIALVVGGDAAFEEGNYEQAVQAYHEVSTIETENIEVVAKLAEAYARLGKSREAAPHFLAVAKYYQENRLFKRALVFLQKVAELDPSNMEARLDLGDLLSREGQELEARKEFQSVAEYYIAQGDLTRAQNCCQRAIQLKSIDAHYLLGEIYIRKELYDEARSELEGFLKIKANHVPAQYSLGIALMRKDLLDESLAVFGKIIGKQSDHVDVLDRMAEIYEKKGNVRDAAMQLVTLASVFMGQKIVDRAETALRRAIDIEPQHLDAHKRLAELFDMRGMKREAAVEYLKAMKIAKEQGVAVEAAACEEKIRAIDPGLLADSATGTSTSASPISTSASPVSTSASPGPSVPPPPPSLVAESMALPVASAPPTSTSASLSPSATSIPVATSTSASPASTSASPGLSVGPPKPKVTPQQRAQRLMNMAQSALKQNLYDEALDMLQQAQQLIPDNQELKATVQKVLREFAKGTSAGKKVAPKAAPAAPPATSAPLAPSSANEPVAPVVPAPSAAPQPSVVPAPSVALEPVASAPAPAASTESVEEMEKRIRSQIEKEYRERTSGSGMAGGAVTREHVLAHAGEPDEPNLAASVVPRPASATPPSPELAAVVPVKPKARPRVSYV